MVPVFNHLMMGLVEVFNYLWSLSRGEWHGAAKSSAEIAESRIMRGGICGQLSLWTGGFQQKCRIVYCGIWISFYRLHWICCYFGSHSLIQGNILHEGPHEKARPICRRENGSLYDLPMETSFGHGNTSLSLQDENPIIGRIIAGNLNIQFFRCLPNRDVISS